MIPLAPSRAAGLLSLLALAACSSSRPGAGAGYPQSAQSPQSAPAGAAQEPGARPSSGYAAPPREAAPPPAAAPITPPVKDSGKDSGKGSGKGSGATKDSATEELSPLAELTVAERSLTLGAVDCATACKALQSMTRAAGRACQAPAPPSSTEPPVDCKDIDSRVTRARARVTEACGACPESP